MLEAPPRFELGRIGFADLCLTTWPWCQYFVFEDSTFEDGLSRPQTSTPPLERVLVDSLHNPRMLRWSGRRDSDPRLPPWQGGILPLNHSRVPKYNSKHISKMQQLFLEICVKRQFFSFCSQNNRFTSHRKPYII